MNKQDIDIVFFFFFGLCIGLLVGHMVTEKYYMNFNKKIDAIIQSYEAK